MLRGCCDRERILLGVETPSESWDRIFVECCFGRVSFVLEFTLGNRIRSLGARCRVVRCPGCQLDTLERDVESCSDAVALFSELFLV